MNPQLTLLVAEQHAAELHRAAEHERLASGSRRRERESRPRNLFARLSARPKRLTSSTVGAGEPEGRPHVDREATVTIRRATSADLASIQEIAELDSQRPPSRPALVAEVGSEIVAAIAIDTDTVIANPFRRTADAVALLRLRAEQLTSPKPASRRALGRLWPRNAAAEA